jgi:hypothetical protein
MDTVMTADRMDAFPRYRAPARDEQIMERYLDTKYREIDVQNGYRILKRIE